MAVITAIGILTVTAIIRLVLTTSAVMNGVTINETISRITVEMLILPIVRCKIKMAISQEMLAAIVWAVSQQRTLAVSRAVTEDLEK